MFDFELEKQLAQANLDCKKYEGDLFVMCEKYSQLEAENNKLKAELKQIEAQDQVVIDGLRKENAKLKCLALHAMGKLFVYMNIHYHTLFKCALDDEYEFQQIACASIKYKRKCEKTNELLIKYNEAYRKAKKELKEGK